jgi:general secretion pathway protein G
MVRRSERGFTLLELIIVVAMIGILATIAMPALKDMPRRAKEAVLKTNLHTIRESLVMFYGDKGRYPGTLEELVPRYLRHVPVDPFTGSNATWVLIFEEDDEFGDVGPAPEDDGELAGPGILDVRSGSGLASLDGTPYGEW